jgi:hypothetical protein
VSLNSSDGLNDAKTASSQTFEMRLRKVSRSWHMTPAADTLKS